MASRDALEVADVDDQTDCRGAAEGATEYGPAMRFCSASAAGDDVDDVCRSIANQVRAELGPGPVDLLIAFAALRPPNELERLPVALHEHLAPGTSIGCTGRPLLAQTERLGQPGAVVVLAGRLPGAKAHAVALQDADLPSPDAPPSAWRDLLPTPEPVRGMIVLCEPNRCDVRALLPGLDYGWPDVPKVGGLASGHRLAEGHMLFSGRSAYRSGAVLVALTGDVQLQPVVAQGCRPIGRAGRITRAHDNRVDTIDEKPARRFVEEQLSGLGEHDLAAAAGNPLYLGLASDPFAVAVPAAGEYLVRNILGIDPNSGGMLVGDRPTVGRQVRLHLRDRASSEHDLATQLRYARPTTAAAALLFRCVAREGDEHRQVTAATGGVPLIGFHCNGEIGPVGATTYLHAYTAALALLRRPEPSRT